MPSSTRTKSPRPKLGGMHVHHYFDAGFAVYTALLVLWVLANVAARLAGGELELSVQTGDRRHRAVDIPFATGVAFLVWLALFGLRTMLAP